MSDLTRRSLLASTAATTLASLLAARAEAAGTSAESEPAALRGTVADGNVLLPPLHQPTELEGNVPNDDAPPRKLGVAVVGLGHLALENIVPAFGRARHVRLAAVMTGDAAKGAAIAAQHGIAASHVYGYDDFERLRADNDVDIVYVVLPNALHAEYVVRAAGAGKHVLCEKPMATTAAECRTMIAACERAGRKLMIAYRLQYAPLHRAVVDLARGGTYGAVRYIEAANGQNDAPNGQWRQIEALAGGGSLPDVGLYCLSAFRYITGEEPTDVTAVTTQPKNDPRFREIEDVCQFTLRFPSGIVATGLSTYSAHESRRLRVCAEGAWFGLDPAFGYDNLSLEIGRREGDTNASEQRRGAPRDQFADEMDAFALSIRQDLVPHTPGEEGLRDQEIMSAIYRAARTGGRIALPYGDTAGRLDVTRGPLPAIAG